MTTVGAHSRAAPPVAMFRFWSSLVVVLLGLFAVAGCRPDDSKVDAAHGAAVVKDIEEWALPLDPYFVTTWDVLWEDYAINLMIAECLRPKGVEFTPVEPVVMGSRQATESPSGRRVFTVETAEKHGYRTTVDDGGLAELAQVRELTEWSLALDDSGKSEFDRCLSEAQRQFGDSVMAHQLAKQPSLQRSRGVVWDGALQDE